MPKVLGALLLSLSLLMFYDRNVGQPTGKLSKSPSDAHTWQAGRRQLARQLSETGRSFCQNMLYAADLTADAGPEEWKPRRQGRLSAGVRACSAQS